MTPEERQQELELQEAMLNEADEIVDAALNRPLTPDEATVIRWHMGTLNRRRDIHA